MLQTLNESSKRIDYKTQANHADSFKSQTLVNYEVVTEDVYVGNHDLKSKASEKDQLKCPKDDADLFVYIQTLF